MSLPQGASDLNRAVLVCQRIKRMSGIVSVLWFRGDLLSGEADGDTLQGSQHADDLADAESGRCTDLSMSEVICTSDLRVRGRLHRSVNFQRVRTRVHGRRVVP